MQNNYVWRATQHNGIVITKGDSLENIAKVELIPQIPSLPHHTFVDQKFVRRFARGFLHGFGGGMKEYLHCIVCEDYRIYLFSSSGAVLISPPSFELYI